MHVILMYVLPGMCMMYANKHSIMVTYSWKNQIVCLLQLYFLYMKIFYYRFPIFIIITCTPSDNYINYSNNNYYLPQLYTPKNWALAPISKTIPALVASSTHIIFSYFHYTFHRFG